MSKFKMLPLMIMAGLFDKSPRSGPKANIGTQPIAPKRESFVMSKQKLKRTKGGKARTNRGKRRGK